MLVVEKNGQQFGSQGQVLNGYRVLLTDKFSRSLNLMSIVAFPIFEQNVGLGYTSNKYNVP